MYLYDQHDQRILDERVTQFRDQTRRYLAGELSDEEFKPLRLMNGLYIQRHAPMLRVAIPYGLMTAEQVRTLAAIARRYDKGYGHFTTRQNIQFNWPRLEDVPQILEDLAAVSMHALQTSGNCIRNITCDHLAGVAEDEIDDPRIWCELLRQWSTLHPEFSYLPRKFKIAISGAEGKDRAASEVHDIGLHLRRGGDGAVGFRVLVGGGLGRTPVIGKVIREFLPQGDFLSYMTAILRVYNEAGRRDNLYKARIKILVNALGIDEFRDQVEKEWQLVREDARLEVTPAQLDWVRERFPLPQCKAAPQAEMAEEDLADGDFARWLRHNTDRHKVPGHSIVYLSLKAPKVPPGDISADQLDAVADMAERYSCGEIRTTHTQNLVFAQVRRDQLAALWRELSEQGLATPNIGSLTDMICCPGLDFCSLANAGTIGIAEEVNKMFDDLDYIHDLGDVRINISGCMNACGHHHVGNIGVLGVDKDGAEWYQITIGGVSGTGARLGKVIGPSVPAAQLVPTLAQILAVYHEGREPEESFVDFVHRAGVAPFKQSIYGGRH